MNDRQDGLGGGTQSKQSTAAQIVEGNLLMTHQVRAQIVSNTLQKGAIGLGVGLALSLSIFRSNQIPTRRFSELIHL